MFPSDLNKTRHSKAALLMASLLLLPLSVPPLQAYAETPQVTTEKKFASIAPKLEHFKLDNGLEVVVIPDHRAPVVTHMVWYKVGSADEPEGQSGVAHFLEHLMFKGTQKYPNGVFSELVAEIGGQENAFTSYDFTAYFQRISKEHLGKMMEMEADRMQNLSLTEEVIAPEKDVVLEERRMRVENDPATRLNEALTAISYVNHPYGSPVIGWESEIRALNQKAIIDFYDRFYTPNNAVVIVAGDVAPEKVRELAQQTYGKLKQRAQPGKRLRPVEPPLPGERRISVSDPRVEQENISMSWITPSQHTGANRTPEAFELLAYILGGNTTSRLYKEMVLKQKSAIDVGSFYQGEMLDDGRFGLYATPAPGHDLQEMENQLASVLKEFVATGVTDEELQRAKYYMLAASIYAQDNQRTLAQVFGTGMATGLSVKDIQSWPSQVQAVTAQDILNAAQTLLAESPIIGLLKKPVAAQSTPQNPTPKS